MYLWYGIAILVWYRIAILHIDLGPLVLKLQVVCLQRYFKNSVTDDFLGILQLFSE